MAPPAVYPSDYTTNANINSLKVCVKACDSADNIDTESGLCMDKASCTFANKAWFMLPSKTKYQCELTADYISGNFLAQNYRLVGFLDTKYKVYEYNAKCGNNWFTTSSTVAKDTD